jgi:hypothetical protein
VLLIKYQPEGGEPFTTIATVSGLLLQERLVWLAYYLDYDDAATVATAEKNTNLILEAILAANF